MLESFVDQDRSFIPVLEELSFSMIRGLKFSLELLVAFDRADIPESSRKHISIDRLPLAQPFHKVSRLIPISALLKILARSEEGPVG